MENEKYLFVVSGAAGTGKDSVVSALRKAHPEIEKTVSATTRSPRPGEVDGRDYYFVDEEKFQRMVAEDGFLEYAAVHGHHYGTPRQPVMEALANGQNVMLDIDPQGALQVMERMPGCVSVFILPPSFAELRRRLEGRHTEQREEIERRLHNARGEVAQMNRYQYLLINDDVDAAYETLKDIVSAEKQRSVRYFPEMED